ncbi:uncharacterized protein LOC144637032 [Oculina patagonica]
MGKTKTKTDKVRMKKSVRKPYSSLPSQQKQDGTTLVAEFERLVKEGLDEGQVNQSNQAQGSNVLVLQGLVMPKCPVDHSELVPYKATNSGERFFRCQKSQCGVICFENNLMDYSKAVAEKLHGSFKMAAPICLLDMTTLLNVSKSQKNYLLPYFTCGQRNKQDRCSYFQWADEKISNKNLQISNEAIKQRNEREAEIQAFLERQKQAVALPAGDDTGFGLSYDCLLKTIILPSEDTTFRQTFRQSLFSVDEFHYLRVSRVGTFTAYDDFDCILKCLRDPLCFSVNLAASKGADGKLWCELLPSDKYRNFTQYKGNKTSHHFAIMSPCSSTPCQNGGTCLANYKDDTFECLCDKGFIGEYCKQAVKSCKELYEVFKSNLSQLVTLHFDSKRTSILCHFGDFGCGDGGWTPVMKIDGNKNTFHYNSGYWSDNNEYNLQGGETGFDAQETKLPSYWNTPFSKICLGMKIVQQINFIVINKQASSLYSLIADGQYRATSLGRNKWKTLIGSQASLQRNCNKEGFNSVGNSSNSKARIGILGNEQNDCRSCDSRIGFGTGGLHDDSNTCGNQATHLADNGNKHIKATGYILVE